MTDSLLPRLPFEEPEDWGMSGEPSVKTSQEPSEETSELSDGVRLSAGEAAALAEETAVGEVTDSGTGSAASDADVASAASDVDADSASDADVASADSATEQAGNVYALKQQLLTRLQELSKGRGNFQEAYDEFKEIQEKWVEIEPVPRKFDTLQNDYVKYSRQFYTLVMRKSIREYAYKKNEEIKTSLCEMAERLTEMSDVVKAFHQLRQLQHQWRLTGFTSNRARRQLEKRFEDAGAIVSERYGKRIEDLKATRRGNLKAKVALCEQMEDIAYDTLQTFKDWDVQYKAVLACQQQWRGIGWVDKRENKQIEDRFHAACTVFYQRKRAFYEEKKASLNRNLELKRALCEKAEALKDSTDRKATVGLLIAMQKEWKTIGPVPYKESQGIWKRFNAACDYFFGQKSPEAAASKEQVASSKGGKSQDTLYNERKELMRTFDRMKSELKTYENNVGFFNVSSKGSGELLKEMEKRIERLKAEMARIVERIDAIDEQLDAIDKQIDEQIEE